MFYISPSPYISLIFLYKQKQLIMLLRGKQLLLTSLFATFVFPTSLAIDISLYVSWLTVSESESSCDWACYTHLGQLNPNVCFDNFLQANSKHIK